MNTLYPDVTRINGRIMKKLPASYIPKSKIERQREEIKRAIEVDYLGEQQTNIANKLDLNNKIENTIRFNDLTNTDLRNTNLLKQGVLEKIKMLELHMHDVATPEIKAHINTIKEGIINDDGITPEVRLRLNNVDNVIDEIESYDYANDSRYLEFSDYALDNIIKTNKMNATYYENYKQRFDEIIEGVRRLINTIDNDVLINELNDILSATSYSMGSKVLIDKISPLLDAYYQTTRSSAVAALIDILNKDSGDAKTIRLPDTPSNEAFNNIANKIKKGLDNTKTDIDKAHDAIEPLDDIDNSAIDKAHDTIEPLDDIDNSAIDQLKKNSDDTHRLEEVDPNAKFDTEVAKYDAEEDDDDDDDDDEDEVDVEISQEDIKIIDKYNRDKFPLLEKKVDVGFTDNQISFFSNIPLLHTLLKNTNSNNDIPIFVLFIVYYLIKAGKIVNTNRINSLFMTKTGNNSARYNKLEEFNYIKDGKAIFTPLDIKLINQTLIKGELTKLAYTADIKSKPIEKPEPKPKPVMLSPSVIPEKNTFANVATSAVESMSNIFNARMFNTGMNPAQKHFNKTLNPEKRRGFYPNK